MTSQVQHAAGGGDTGSPVTAGTQMRAIVQNRYGEEAAEVLRPGGALVSVGSEQGNRWVGGRGWIQAML
jgi:hypothetical protein